ncbi:hypothetical protein CONPUDRAFT_75804 [Coniophora puteana RWD-64-598 SS2]|uniref:Uncharacterized protein n=1 Tax=Coniophora puteana (strain RWD-64-598) TaxID=741705 RepID=A0A5M3MHG2_CONPW|nr:uncharacterized protein CONPUDRAFT_75804 [Coniophora puteana RWD-64-598 SS2]EIW78075.1 hypothetical protein CONPUDRAFT_75804 [Coniophora puteana RWD-64-598 SS2]
MSATSRTQATPSNAAPSAAVPAMMEQLPSWWPTRSMDKNNDDQRQNFLDIVELRILEIYDHLNVPESDRRRFEHNWKVEWGNLNPILCRLFHQISKNGAKGNLRYHTMGMMIRNNSIPLFHPDFKKMKHGRGKYRPPQVHLDIGDRWWVTGTTLKDPIPPQPKTKTSGNQSKSTPSASSSPPKPAPTAGSHPAPTAPKNPPTSAAPARAGATTAPPPSVPPLHAPASTLKEPVAPIPGQSPAAPLTSPVEPLNANASEEEEDTEAQSPTPAHTRRLILRPPRIPDTPPEDDGRPVGSARAPALAAPQQSSAGPSQAPAPTSIGAATDTGANKAAPTSSVKALQDGIPAFDQYQVPHRSLPPIDWKQNGVSAFNVSIPTSDHEAFDMREVLLNNTLVDLDDAMGLMRDELGQFKNEMKAQFAEIKAKGPEEESRMAVDPAL